MLVTSSHEEWVLWDRSGSVVAITHVAPGAPAGIWIALHAAQYPQAYELTIERANGQTETHRVFPRRLTYAQTLAVTHYLFGYEQSEQDRLLGAHWLASRLPETLRGYVIRLIALTMQGELALRATDAILVAPISRRIAGDIIAECLKLEGEQAKRLINHLAGKLPADLIAKAKE